MAIGQIEMTDSDGLDATVGSCALSYLTADVDQSQRRSFPESQHYGDVSLSMFLCGLPSLSLQSPPRQPVLKRNGENDEALNEDTLSQSLFNPQLRGNLPWKETTNFYFLGVSEICRPSQ